MTDGREIQYWRSIDRGNGFDIGNVRSRLANLSYMTIVKLNLVEIEQQLRSGSGMKISSSCWSNSKHRGIMLTL